MAETLLEFCIYFVVIAVVFALAIAFVIGTAWLLYCAFGFWGAMAGLFLLLCAGSAYKAMRDDDE